MLEGARRDQRILNVRRDDNATHRARERRQLVAIEAQDYPSIRVERTMEAKSVTEPKPGVYVYDSFDALRDAQSCWAVQDDQIRYQDEDHLSVDGSLRLTDGLTQTLRTAFATG